MRRLRRSKSHVIAEAVSASTESREWQLGEIQAGLSDLDRGDAMRHERVVEWLKSWGKPSDRKRPR